MEKKELNKSIKILEIVCKEKRISPERIYKMFDSKDKAESVCRILKEKGAGQIEFTKGIYCFNKNPYTLTVLTELRKIRRDRRNKTIYHSIVILGILGGLWLAVLKTADWFSSKDKIKTIDTLIIEKEIPNITNQKTIDSTLMMKKDSLAVK
ncbi:MAG: hypothetical protein ACEPOZ_10360 [Marinifilaceae bacterium]